MANIKTTGRKRGSSRKPLAKQQPEEHGLPLASILLTPDINFSLINLLLFAPITGPQCVCVCV